jgi:hypothetical protein
MAAAGSDAPSGHPLVVQRRRAPAPARHPSSQPDRWRRRRRTLHRSVCALQSGKRHAAL